MSQQRAAIPVSRRSLAACLSVTLAVLVACSQDPTGSGTGGLPRSPALVSAPVPARRAEPRGCAWGWPTSPCGPAPTPPASA